MKRLFLASSIDQTGKAIAKQIGNVEKAAEFLCIGKSKLYRKIREPFNHLDGFDIEKVLEDIGAMNKLENIIRNGNPRYAEHQAATSDTGKTRAIYI